MNNPDVPEKRKVRNYIEYTKKPWTVKQLVVETGVKWETARQCVRKYYRKGIIKQVDKIVNAKVYAKVRNQRQLSSKKDNPLIKKQKQSLINRFCDALMQRQKNMWESEECEQLGEKLATVSF